MEIIVIGGGIGGLATAVALQRRGLDAHVYESAPELAPVGKGIWVPTNAMLVLDRLGLGDAVAARGVPLDHVELRDKDGGVLQKVNLSDVRSRFGRTTVSILRAELHAALADALRPGTLHLGKQCVAVHEGESGPVALFEDGTTAEGDVLVGADGLRSVVREAVVPDVPLRYSGQACYLGIADFRLPPGFKKTAWEVWGGAHRFGFSPVDEDRVYWFAPYTTSEEAVPAGPATPAEVAVLCDRYAGFPGPIPEIVRQTPEREVIRVNLSDIAPIQRWSRGRIVLVGDAAHAMTPNLGQGGAQAIEDAFVLADALVRETDPESAFTSYEQIRRPKANRIASTAWRLGKLAHLEGQWTRRLRNTAMRATPERISRRQIEALYTLNY